MCGISGVIDLKKRTIDTHTIETMNAALAHRGPNDEGTYLGGYVGLGHRRLSILDLSTAGHQPMRGRTGTVHVVFNGEIYNYLELRKEIGGAFSSNSDTEVLLAAYEKWGEQCIEKLNGIFAFGVWDQANEKLILARDRLGVKPLYYVEHNGKLFFSSEIKALLKVGVSAKPNDGIIYEYLAYGFYEHSEQTFFKNIKQLMPGHTLVYQGGKYTVRRYWSLPESVEDLSALTDKEVSKRYVDLITNAVTIQMRSDVPIGINASGGLDCSILAHLVNNISGGQKNFRLYSWTYGEDTYDETPYVEALAKSLGWSVEFFELNPKLALDLLPHVLAAEEQPFPGVSIIARHNLYRLADKESIVMLEGHGGDEIGGGYEYYYGSFLLDVLTEKGFTESAHELKMYGKERGIRDDALLLFFKRGLDAYLRGGTSADGTQFIQRDVLNPEFVRSAGTPIPHFEQPFKSFLANMQYRDLHWTKEPRVLRSVDRNAMAYGKEVRVPFLDHRVVEFAFSLSPYHKIRNGEQRFFMREAFRKALPENIVNVPKRSVPDPQRDWLKGPLKEWAWDILSSPSFGKRKYFNQEQVLAEYEKFYSNPKANNSFHIWQWLNLELWLRTYID